MESEVVEGEAACKEACSLIMLWKYTWKKFSDTREWEAALRAEANSATTKVERTECLMVYA